MIIYVLLVHDHDITFVEGVFTSRKKVKEYIGNDKNLSVRGMDWQIESHVADPE